MFPAASTAGLATGWTPSAIWTPISQAHAGLASSPLRITSSPTEAVSGTRAMTRESEPMTTGASTSPKETRGRADLAKHFPRI